MWPWRYLNSAGLRRELTNGGLERWEAVPRTGPGRILRKLALLNPSAEHEGPSAVRKEGASSPAGRLRRARYGRR